MPLLILSAIVQIALVVHVIKTGRNTTWIWVVMLLPLAGSVAYLLLELGPDLMSSRSGKSAQRKIQSVVNPNGGLNHATAQLQQTDTVENAIRVAEECYDKRLYEDAQQLLQRALTGAYSDDPLLMFRLAACHFELGQYTECKTLLDQLIEQNSDYKNQEAHLLYARTLVALDDSDKAIHEFDALEQYYTGPDAKFYYGQLLKQQQKYAQALPLFESIVAASEQSGRHYKSLHKDIVRQAKEELQAPVE